jgi:hypothetical protein
MQIHIYIYIYTHTHIYTCYKILKTYIFKQENISFKDQNIKIIFSKQKYESIYSQFLE